MGSISAMRSLDRVLSAHRRDLEVEAFEELPTSLRDLRPAIDLVNESHWIARWVTLSADDPSESFELRRLDLYELAERYPELDLGW